MVFTYNLATMIILGLLAILNWLFFKGKPDSMESEKENKTFGTLISETITQAKQAL